MWDSNPRALSNTLLSREVHLAELCQLTILNLFIATQCPSRALNVSTTPATGFRYNNKCLGRLATHIWEPYTHKQNLVPPTRIELVMTGYQPIVIPFNYRGIYLVQPTGIEPVSTGLQSAAMTTSAKVA